MFKKMGLLVVALLLVLAACGDDDGGGALSAEEQAKADELKAELMADTSASNPFTNEEDAACFSEAVVRSFGLARINELNSAEGGAAGLASLTDEEKSTMADLALECVDFGAVIRTQIAAYPIPQDMVDCVVAGIDNDLLKTLFIAQMSGEDPATNPDLLAVVAACATP